MTSNISCFCSASSQQEDKSFNSIQCAPLYLYMYCILILFSCIVLSVMLHAVSSNLETKLLDDYCHFIVMHNIFVCLALSLVYLKQNGNSFPINCVEPLFHHMITLGKTKHLYSLFYPNPHAIKEYHIVLCGFGLFGLQYHDGDASSDVIWKITRQNYQLLMS